MRKVNLRMKEERNYLVIKKLVETDGNKKRAALELGYTEKHINRMIKGYIENGKDFFSHGNKGKKPKHTIADNTKQLILDLYRTKYQDANFEHYKELLEKHENINVSVSVIRSVLMNEFILSPKARRITRKKFKEQLKVLKNTAKSNKELATFTEKILDIEDAHPRRPRCANFGELLQMDASIHLWFGDKKTQLHIAVDDATGSIVGAYFDHQETLNGYYNILHQILSNHGIPYRILTDRRTVFEYKQKNSTSTEDDTFTQFGYACHQLGIDLKTSSVPQAKGRVERMFQTLQSRLPLELMLAGVNTIELANEFLNSYIKEFNAKFSLPIDNIKSVFDNQVDIEKINLTLAVITNRKVDNGHCIKFKNEYYKTVDKNNLPVYLYSKTEGMVIQTFDNRLFFCANDIIFSLMIVPSHERISKDFDIKASQDVVKKKYIPPMTHPWKKKSFDDFAKKQAHRSNIPA